MNEIWTFNRFPNADELPDPFTVYIDESTDPVTIRTSPMPEPVTIAGEGWRRLLDLCFDRADRFSLHRCGYPKAQEGTLERKLQPFLIGEYRSYACLHLHGKKFWEKCCLYRAKNEAKTVLLYYITHLFGQEPAKASQDLPERYHAYEQAQEEAAKRLEDYIDRAEGNLTMKELEAFEKKNFQEARRLWQEAFNPADFPSHMEDLCFFRGQEEFFETITHEGLCFVRVQDPEFARELRKLGVWRDETEGFHGRLFSLDEAKDFVKCK